MLAELRKYHVCLILANQYSGQLDVEIRDAVVSNVGTLICFRLSATDASYFARELEGTFAERDLINLPNFHYELTSMHSKWCRLERAPS